MRVTQIWRYPIKSVGGEQLEASGVTEFGVEGDRGWGLVDEPTGFVLTARREPRLLMATGRLVDGQPVATTEAGDELRTSAEWSAWLDRPVRLEKAGAEGGTYENPLDIDNEADWVKWQGPSEAWHDSSRSRISLVSAASLGDWDVRRFRPNLVTDGEGEDALIGRRVRIGAVTATVMKAIDRCIMVTRPQPGLDRDLDVLRTVNRDHGSTLCIGALIDEGGHIATGDRVEAIS